MAFYALEPEVAGRHGERSIVDRSVHPPRVTVLHHIFDGWLGDELLESFPAFLVTESLSKLIEAEQLTGVRFSDAIEVEASEQFEELYPGRQLPKFRRLEPLGVPLQSDFALGPDHRLIVSERALRVLDSTSPAQLDRELLGP